MITYLSENWFYKIKNIQNLKFSASSYETTNEMSGCFGQELLAFSLEVPSMRSPLEVSGDLGVSDEPQDPGSSSHPSVLELLQSDPVGVDVLPRPGIRGL